ncbi:hypothetical protein [Chiayiivirga flava]|uniref:DUF3352 domain-containing protein n=1 Tax=Chiayiivirga flava TaxID=659595 RepID=A0A7W8D3Y3_9GAMM|nr:hypothetical protein [Chiayiivirga flava]MBB5207493.1 hypothetical protein [Chiayiivirga flava]
MRKLVAVVVAVALLAAGAWWFFGRDGGLPGVGGGAATIAADAPLDFVPADTPYVFANLEPLPQAERERWMGQMDGVAAMWKSQIAVMRARLAEQDDADAQVVSRWVDALDAEFAGKSVEQVVASLGASLEGHGAFYGVGLAPVMRSELADPDALRATVARMEQRTGHTLATASIDGIGYWYVALPGTTLRAIFAIQDRHLVITVGPGADDAALRTLLGIERPARSLRDSGALQALNATFGYLPVGGGYVDTARIADLLTSPATPLETALLAAIDVEKPAVDAACRSEAALLATLVPRLSAGYTRIADGHMDMATRIETLPKIAADLQTLRTPMPGPRMADDALFDFGIGLKVGALPAVLNAWADAAQAQTFACPQLADLNATATQLRSGSSNAAIYTVAPVFSAMRLMLTRVDLDSMKAGTPDASGKILIASGNPAALLSMAKNFAPEIASIDLKPDGKVVAIPTLAANPLPLPVFAAMSPQVLALGVGADQQAMLGADLALDPAFQPLLVYGIDGTAYADFMRFGMAQAAAAATTDAERKEAEDMGAMMHQLYSTWVKRIDVTVDVDAHGVVIEQRMRMP